ncbi:MAG: cobalamin B12-binding domain-containing protein [Thermoplasmata archaeon]|nr:MAG: cobalamin B12-binding domain-containing protein [Thermoplasmata archaeon]
MEKRPIRILVAKPGLDGHDRGAKVVAHALRNAGFEVIYTGLHQTIEQIVEAAIQEDVDFIGLSILSGAHIPIAEKLMKKLEEEGARDITVIVGGNIPKKDFDSLNKLGVEAVYPTGSNFEDIVNFIKKKAEGVS